MEVVGESAATVGAEVSGPAEPPGADWYIDQALRELADYRRGTLDVRTESADVGFGEVLLAGGERGLDHHVMTIVRPSDGAIAPVAVGNVEEVVAAFAQLLADGRLEEIVDSAPRLLLGGALRPFSPAFGRYLVGIIELAADEAVLMVALERTFALLHVDRWRQEVIHAGVPLALRESDLAAHLDLAGALRRRTPRRERRPRTVRAPQSIRHRHCDIVYGRRVDTRDGPPMRAVLRRMEESIVAAVKRQRDRAAHVIRTFFQLGERGALDPEGRVSRVAAILKAADPTLEITTAQLGVVLRHIHTTGTALIERPTARTWRICVEGIADPTSALHKALLAQTRPWIRVDAENREVWGEPAAASEGSSRARPASAKADTVEERSAQTVDNDLQAVEEFVRRERERVEQAAAAIRDFASASRQEPTQGAGACPVDDLSAPAENDGRADEETKEAARSVADGPAGSVDNERLSPIGVAHPCFRWPVLRGDAAVLAMAATCPAPPAPIMSSSLPPLGSSGCESEAYAVTPATPLPWRETCGARSRVQTPPVSQARRVELHRPHPRGPPAE